MQTDWKKDLDRGQLGFNDRWPGGLHVPAEELDLHRYHCFSDPDQSEDARKHHGLLLSRSCHREQQTKQQAEYEGAPAPNVSKMNTEYLSAWALFHHKSQSLKPSLIPPCSTTSASGHLPAMPLIVPLSPRSAPPIPPPLCRIPPRRYFGHSTCLIFSHTANRSLDRVSHTDSSIVFVGARRSSPGIEEFRYDCGRGFRDDEDWMLPVSGARSEFVCIGSSRSLMLANEWNVSIGYVIGISKHTIVRVNKVLLDFSVVIVVVRVA